MLAELQARFSDCVLGAVDDLGPALKDPRGLGIYRANVLGAWTRTLALAHPATRAALGAQAFDAVALAFARSAPPARPELNVYGAGFAAFLRGREEGPAWLADLAALEFALHRSYFAKDEEALDPAGLAALDADAMTRLCLRPQSALRLIASDYPLVALHAHLLRDAPPPASAMSATWTLVWRHGLDVRFRVCGRGEAAMLAALLARHPLMAAAQQGVDADSGFDVQAALSQHFCDGVYVAAELEEISA